jgi:hypothetical protein
MHGNPGRIAAAFGFTLADAIRQAIGELIDLVDSKPSTVVRGGGLRGGGFTLTSNRLILRRYEYLGGLRVSARLGGKRPVRLHVRGRYANGTLVVHRRGLVTGRLSGQRVRFRISSGYRFPAGASIAGVRAAAATLARDRFGGDLRPPHPVALAARRELSAGGVDVTPAG